MTNGYKAKLEIHRRDNDKGYSPENCEFLTNREHNKKHKNIEWFKTHKGYV
jgi:hypothetical protein